MTGALRTAQAQTRKVLTGRRDDSNFSHGLTYAIKLTKSKVVVDIEIT